MSTSSPLLSDSVPSLALHVLDARLAEAEAYLLDAGGVVTDDVDAALDVLLDARDDKVAAYVALIRNNEATAKAYADEAARLDAHRRAHENTAKRLKERLLASMLERGDVLHATPIGSVRVQYASTRKVIPHGDVSDLPERFRVVSVAADLRALGDALKAGDAEAQSLAHLADPTPFLGLR